MIRWLPNMVSLLRLMLCVPYFFWLAESTFEAKTVILALIIIASDKIDGFLARKFKVTSQLGEALDAFADGVFFIGTWILLFMLDLISIGFLIGLLAQRSIMLISLCTFYLRKKRWSNTHFTANKIGAVAHFFGIPWFLLNLPGREFVLILVIIISVGSIFFSEYKRHTQA